MIYLDNAGTTKMFEQCVKVHQEFSCEKFFNPSALSVQSMEVSKQIADAERYFLSRLGAKEGNVLFTGCATESNNLAIRGSLRAGNWEYVFSSGEHPSVFNLAKKLQLDGHKVIFVPLLANGTVDLDALSMVLNEKTRLLSIMHVSNETGAINDLVKISALKQRLCPQAIFHVDGVQAFMKIPFSLDKTAIDLYSFSGHKFHAPKGIAGLYVKNKSALKSLFEGGGQQYSLRSGTENVSGIMQMMTACQLIDVKANFEKTQALKECFNDQLLLQARKLGVFCQKVDVHDFQEAEKQQDRGILIRDYGGSAYIENLIFEQVKGETMLHALNQNGVIVGLGSACSAKKAGNRVLEKIGLKKEEIVSSVRISFNAYMSEKEVCDAAKIIVETYKNVKEKLL